MIMEYWRNDNDNGKQEYPDKNLASLSLCPTQISQVLAWDRTWHSAVTAQRIISWITEFSIAGPIKILGQISNNSLLKKRGVFQDRLLFSLSGHSDVLPCTLVDTPNISEERWHLSTNIGVTF